MPLTPADLDALRRTGDPGADSVVAELFASGQLSGVNEVLRAFDDNDQPVPGGLPPSLAVFLERSAVIPEWADPERISGAYDFFKDDGMQLVTVLGTGSMVGCFASVHGAKAMALTHRMDQPNRRMQETLQFLLYLMASGPLGPGGRLVRACQKVRLVHAAVRHLISASGEWDCERLGAPVNQEQLLAGIVWFSVCAAEGAKRLGVHVTPKELRDYYHLWCVTGSLLGVDRAVMPDTPDEAMALWRDVLKERLWGPSPEGVALTRTLIDRQTADVPKVVRGLMPALIRQVLDREAADFTQVPDSAVWSLGVRAAVGVSKVLEQAEDHLPAAERILDRWGQNLTAAHARWFLGGKEQEFDIPASLRADWFGEPPNRDTRP